MHPVPDSACAGERGRLRRRRQREAHAARRAATAGRSRNRRPPTARLRSHPRQRCLNPYFCSFSPLSRAMPSGQARTGLLAGPRIGVGQAKEFAIGHVNSGPGWSKTGRYLGVQNGSVGSAEGFFGRRGGLGRAAMMPKVFSVFKCKTHSRYVICLGDITSVTWL